MRHRISMSWGRTLTSKWRLKPCKVMRGQFKRTALAQAIAWAAGCVHSTVAPGDTVRKAPCSVKLRLAGANQTMRHAELVGEGALRLPEHGARKQAALDLGDLGIG
jgi:hypothetical protein